MSRLVNIVRLGLTRGWKVRLINQHKIYSSSLIHCMLLYLLMRSKSFRVGLWVVLYSISSSLKKYSIHIYFWRLPGWKKIRITERTSTIKILKRKKQKFISGESVVRLRFLPTRCRSGLFFRYGKFRLPKLKTPRKRPLRDKKRLAKLIAIEKEKAEKAAKEKAAKEKSSSPEKDDRIGGAVTNKNVATKPAKPKYVHKQRWVPKKKISRLTNLWIPAGKMFCWWLALDYVKNT